MTMTDKKLERCKKYLRSTLLSNKGGIPAGEVFKHYQNLVGEGIPYTQFNFSSLEAFLSSIPDVCQICWSGRDLMVVGVAGQASEHIEKMVSRQQNGKKRQTRRPPAPPRFGGGGSFGTGSTWGGGGGSTRQAVNSQPRYRPPPVVKKSVITSPFKKTQIAPITPRKKIDLSTPVQNERVYLETVGGQAVYGSRVENLMQGRQHGLFTSQVEKMYQKKWEQSLPKDWCKVMGRAGKVRLEREAGASPMVYPAGKEGTPSLSYIPLPSTPEWEITVCSVSSSDQIHFWLGEAKEQLSRLHTSMLLHHMVLSIGRTTSDRPEVGSLYSALVSDGQCRRVRVLQVDRSNNTCRCLMLDYGEEEVVQWNRLIKLELKFMELPIQAVKATLAGVDRNTEKKVVQFVTQCLMGRRLVGVLVGEVINTIPALVLFDTSQEEDIMVSEEIIKYMGNITNLVTMYTTKSRPIAHYPKYSQILECLPSCRHPSLTLGSILTW
eukprot:GFUD01025626.1.p1 GENE.GFUD01025626.1~~GFUD01025626.1.p1  ORF type:complete len:492 (-),score=144.64 GFUD01025626.1:594-2069(-)